MSVNRSIDWLGILMIGATTSCANIKELTSLQRGLVREFETPGVNVNLNNRTHLTITFANSPIGALSEKEQAAFARRVAEFVRDQYAGYGRLASIRVGFSTVKGIGITVTSTRIPYQFTPAQLGAPRPPKRDTVAKAAV